jgi:hypothetical protein
LADGHRSQNQSLRRLRSSKKLPATIGNVTDYGVRPKSEPVANLYAPAGNNQSAPGAANYTQGLLNAMNPTMAAAPTFDQYSYEGDPAYQQALALGTQGVDDATANASAARQQALIG